MILHSLFEKLGSYLRNLTHKRFLKKITDFIKENNKILLIILIFALLIDIFSLKRNMDFIIFGLLLFYGILVKISHVKSKFTFLLCLALLGVMFVDFIITGTSVSTEKAAVWFILFLGFGIIHQWKELKY